MTRRIAITGVDGTGKSSLVAEITKRTLTEGLSAEVIPCPQYHLNPDLPLTKLSQVIEKLNSAADFHQDYQVKGVALVLSMTLFGEIENHVLNCYQPDLLIQERQCILDSITYGAMYRSTMGRELDPEKTRQTLHNFVAPSELVIVEKWINRLCAKNPSLFLDGPVNFYTIPHVIEVIFSQPEDKLALSLMRLYNTTLPNSIVLLTADPKSLSERLRWRYGTGEMPELHEDIESLMPLQTSLMKQAHKLQINYPMLQVYEMKIENKSIQDLADEIDQRCFSKARPFSETITDQSPLPV